MPLTDAEQAARNRLQSFYEGDNPYNSVTNPGGLRQGGQVFNFVPALKDVATVLVAVSRLAAEVVTNSAQSPKAVRVDGAQGYTDDEKAQGQANLGLAGVLTSFLAKVGGTLTGRLKVSYLNASISLNNTGPTSTNKGFNLLANDSDGLFYVQAYDGDVYAANMLSLTRAGLLWTAGMGDVSARIESRASAYAAQRLSLTGGSLTGQLVVPYLQVSNDPNAGIATGSRDNSAGFLLYSGSNRWRAYTGSGDVFSIGSDGSLSTSQLGDLSTRIEARGAAYRDAALATARGEYLYRSGGQMTGRLYSTSIEMNGADASILYRNRDDSNTAFATYATASRWRLYYGADIFHVGVAGDIVTAQIGDLSTRIETRGAAYRDSAVNSSVQKTGGTMTGDLTISKTYPSISMNYAGGISWSFSVREWGGWVLFANNSDVLGVGADGTVYTKQIGDLKNYIDSKVSVVAQSIGDNGGYVRYSNGYCRQWGTANGPDVTVSFPLAFSKIPGVQLTITGGSSQNIIESIWASRLTTASFDARARYYTGTTLAGDGVAFSWAAEGFI